MNIMPTTEPISLAQQIECVEREINMRLRVYPRLISQQKMSQVKADKELAAMRAVLETLHAIDRGHVAPA